MGGFLYFLPTERRAGDAALLALHGCGHAVDAGRGIATRFTQSGPGGAAGLLVMVDGDFASTFELAYRPNSQTWRQGPTRTHEGKDLAYWVGAENPPEAMPDPTALARKRFIAGHAVAMLDGREWTIPIARSVVRGSTLPKRLVLGPDNQTWTPQELPEFLGLCKEAETAYTLLHGGEADAEGRVTIEIPYDVGMRIALAALAVNYRIGPIEADMLGLFGESEMEATMKAVCDWPAYEAVLLARQKKEPASVT